MNDALNENRAREEICRIGRSLFERGYVHASAGNISVRLSAEHGGGFLITPTDACLGFLDPARLARMDAEGRQISGDKASKTLTLHRSIYEANARAGQDARCVLHTHSTYCVAMTLQAPFARPDGGKTAAGSLPWPELLPAITPYFVMKVGHVPVIGYQRPGSPDSASDCVAAIAAYAARGTPIRAVMLERLGPNVWHHTPAAAMATLEELEESARLWMLSTPKPESLKDSSLEELRQSFGALW